MTASRLPYAIFGASFALLSPLAFYSKSPVVFYRFDGTYLLILATMAKTWAIGGVAFTSNPLQGLGGFDLFWHALWEPGLWLVAHTPPWLAPTVGMTFYAAVLGVTICWTAVRLGLSPTAAVLAAWTGLLVTLPYVYPTLGFEFIWGVPTDVIYIALNTAIIFLFADLGLGPRPDDTARFAGISAICIYLLLEIPAYAPVNLAALSYFCLVALLASQTKRERLIKLLAGGFIALIALLTVGKMYYGLWGFNKATFFWPELYSRSFSLTDQSFFLAAPARWPAWVVYGLAIAGACHAAWRGNHLLRFFARGLLVFVIGTFALIWVIGGSWRGPRIAYIDVFAFPFYCVFSAYGVATLVQPLSEFFKLSKSWILVSAVTVSALPWLVLLDYRPTPLDRPGIRGGNPFIWPPLETPIVKFLADKIALQPGAVFRGRVASVAGSDFQPQWIQVPFVGQHDYDAMNLFHSGNDHRMYGLWYFGIPTLFEANQFSSPFFHLVNSRLLNAPDSIATRAYGTQSIANDRILALLGTRYFLSDKRADTRTPTFQYEITKGRDLYVYPVDDSNVAGYAVTQTRHVDSAREMIAILRDASVDLREVAVLSTRDLVPSLTPAIDSKLIVDRGAYRIEARTSGTSLLVLPIEFSHCLQADLRSNGAAVKILRANLTMTALLFTGHVEGALKLRYGPWSSDCRLEDWRDAIALRISDARD